MAKEAKIGRTTKTEIEAKSFWLVSPSLSPNFDTRAGQTKEMHGRCSANAFARSPSFWPQHQEQKWEWRKKAPAAPVHGENPHLCARVRQGEGCFPPFSSWPYTEANHSYGAILKLCSEKTHTPKILRVNLPLCIKEMGKEPYC